MMIDHMEDNELITHCLQGNGGSYKEIMDKYRGYAMAVALNILTNFQDAEDACQEAFFKAFQNLNQFDMGMSFKNWFYALLYHHCMDHIRKRKRFRHFMDRFKNEQPSSVSLPSSCPPQNPAVESAYLRRLSPKERIALYLWSQEGYSGADIASVLGCSQGTAYVHLYRARLKLKSILTGKKHAPL